MDDLKMYLDNLESFWMILKMSGLCKKSPDELRMCLGDLDPL